MLHYFCLQHKGNNENDCNTCDSFIGIGILHAYVSSGMTFNDLVPSKASLFVSEHYNCAVYNFCSGRGQCTSSGCSCDATLGYGGSSCTIPICNGLLATNLAVCSGKGNCTAPGILHCFLTFRYLYMHSWSNWATVRRKVSSTHWFRYTESTSKKLL